MAAHNQTGADGEAAALAYLLTLGYTLRHRNWRYGRDLELDLVLELRGELVIVEVKTLTANGSFQGEDRLTRAKCRKLVQAAEAYEALENWNGPIRFDVVVVQAGTVRHTIDVDVVSLARSK